MSDAIVTRGLTKYYGRRCVVDALDLHVPQGAVYGLLGRNGSGKSTTIKMLVGLVQPDRGDARLLGEDVSALQPATKARVAYIAEGHPFFRWMTIAEAVTSRHSPTSTST
ncbi:MAG: ATP-binding cassette domain-containing protein, partial [Pirellulales bacterium]